MLEVLVVGLAVAATARTARGRDASAWVFASLALVGWLVLKFGLAAGVTRLFDGGGLPRGGALMALEIGVMLAPWAWLAAVFFYVRSVPGRTHVQPPGQWTCPECRWLNAGSVFRCEACKAEYRATTSPVS
jgi:hypothetical protein